MGFLELIGIATGLALVSAVLATVAGHLVRPAEGEPRASNTLVAFAAAAAAVLCMAALALAVLWLLGPFLDIGD